MTLPPAVIIHGLPHALSVLAAARPVTLLSAPGAACYAGCGWWRAVIAAALAAHPGAAAPDVLDCGDSPGRALEALRKGAGDMMRTIMQAQGQGNPQPGGSAQSGQGRDPLGRENGGTGGTVKIPDEIDIQRAREILDAIRKRLTDGNSNTMERNYLERLLDLKL